MTDEAAAKAAVDKAVEVFGRLDVVVNNAGYGDIAPFEQVSSERFRAVIDTNFFGVVSMTRAAIPIMRRQKSGYILQISSVGGRLATAGGASYHAAKWAIGGFTEAIAQEVAAFGVKVCALEPGGMRTNYGNRATADTPTLLPEYEPSVGSLIKMLEGYWGHETGDPAMVAQVPNRRGRGQSGKYGDHFNIMSEVEDMQALMARAEAYNLCGLSEGGLVVLRTTLATPAGRKSLPSPS